jgi:hypothetical protein
LVLGVLWTVTVLWVPTIDADNGTEHGVSTTGTIVALTTRHASKGVRCTPVVRYHVDGVAYEAAMGGSTREWCLSMPGDQVELVYDATMPEHADIPSPTGLPVAVWGAAAIGLLLVALGMAMTARLVRVRLRGEHDPTVGPARATPAQGDPPAMWTGRAPRF